MDIYEKIWSQVLDYLEKNLTQISFDTWIKPLSIHKIDEVLNIAYLEVPNGRGQDLALKTLKDRYIKYLEDGFNKVLNENVKVIIKPVQEYDDNITIEEKEEPKIPKGRKIKQSKEKIFNPNYTFENFVVGSSNQFAYAASLAVAESPSDSYNPVFIYGGSGLGKTHLLHAIGIYLLTKNPDLNILYVSSEMFTNEMIKAISDHTTNQFKQKYRNLDVLLIDDIQFLEGKDSTQEEFFYTFEALYNLNKQIIIASDRAPEKLEKLDKRLTSRFMWNMVADIQPPDYETRIAILTKKAENSGIEIDQDLYEVICIISEKMKDNIRELEGAFNRIISFSKLMNQHIDRQFAKQVLNDIFKNNESKITPVKIKKAVCKKYNIKLSDLDSKKRTSNISYPRQVAMYLVRELTDYSLPQIGKIFNGKHHTTISYACEKIEYDIKHDEKIKNLIMELRAEIKE